MKTLQVLLLIILSVMLISFIYLTLQQTQFAEIIAGVIVVFLNGLSAWMLYKYLKQNN